MSAGRDNEADAGAPRKRSCLKRILRVCLYLFAFLLLAGVAVALGGYLVYDHVTRPGVPGEPVRVLVPEGATGRDAGRILCEAGLIEREEFLRLAIHLDTRGGTIKHGLYDLPKGLSPTQLLHLLYDGPNAGFSPDELAPELKVTVPEGLSLGQVAALFDDPEVFIEAASDPELMARLGIEADSLEGFLMPNTYYFDEKPSGRDVVERMVAQFEREYAALSAEIPGPPEQDLRRLVTVASLVEEEAVVDEERPLIAAVIYNRLERDMCLELDATLQYALGKYGQRMLNGDKEVDSPYNTYRHRGLPPGPICSPGVKSLRAAMAPAGEDYLFFVSNADGRTHTFSKTMSEHTAAVKRYRRAIAAQRRELRERESHEQEAE
ncbi:MAG: endolytic transglycosylase MltG [Candidatus Hydrogenedentes bacterium]|nr:endolytic transglycosylase MltG [Candidatus Hydrogenedentota bacterium]